MRRLKLSAWRARAERRVQQRDFVVRRPSRSPVAFGDPEGLPIALTAGVPGAPPTLTVGKDPGGYALGGRSRGAGEWRILCATEAAFEAALARGPTLRIALYRTLSFLSLEPCIVASEPNRPRSALGIEPPSLVKPCCRPRDLRAKRRLTKKAETRDKWQGTHSGPEGVEPPSPGKSEDPRGL